jgi:hypothetical protein
MRSEAANGHCALLTHSPMNLAQGGCEAGVTCSFADGIAATASAASGRNASPPPTRRMDSPIQRYF